ncbi:MAG TPA: hypothetical protein VGR81_00895 [Candidatus Acidoferrales bacterium]|nr:hypothetical protein [Candidatus Acidoferrales bacterium]
MKRIRTGKSFSLLVYLFLFVVGGGCAGGALSLLLLKLKLLGDPGGQKVMFLLVSVIGPLAGLIAFVLRYGKRLKEGS